MAISRNGGIRVTVPVRTPLEAAAGLAISWPLRLFIWVEILFGVAAIATIALMPSETARYFAWPIKPNVTAALLGAFYISAGGLFILAAFTRRWQMIRVLVIPAMLFTLFELIATFLHWDRFAVGTTPFMVWFASYLLPPPVFAACYIWHQRRSPKRQADAPLSPMVRNTLWVLGIAVAGEGLISFIWPAVLINSAPWTLSPLTTRAICGWLISLGTMMLSVAWENDRDRGRVVAPYFILLLPALVLQLSRYSHEVNWSHPRIGSGAVFLTIVLAIGIYLARGNWRRSFQ